MDAITIGNNDMHLNYILKCPLIYAKYKYIILIVTIIKMWNDL